MLAPAAHGNLGALEPGDDLAMGSASAFCREQVRSTGPTPTIRGSIESGNNFKRIGCLLGWWMVRGTLPAQADSFTLEFFRCWSGDRATEKQSPRVRARGSTFPLRERELGLYIDTMLACTLHEALAEAAVLRWHVEAWMYLVFVGLNSLSGAVPRPERGRWIQTEGRAAQSIRNRVEVRCQKDVAESSWTEEDWQKDMKSRVVGYGGEEIAVCECLTWEQVIPSLPPGEHGATVDALDWVGPRTKYFLQNPKELLKDPKDVVLPRLPGKVHVRAGDKLRIAEELVRRNVCQWIPLDKVYKVGEQPVLNGLFGVSKPSLLEDGRPILRLIMNLVGSNSTQEQLVGGCDSLPSITSWQSIVMDGNEVLSCHQSDMSSAFYLFRLPKVWQPYLSFNILVRGEDINGVRGAMYALACNVIPMGWHNSVGIMQEISENLMKRNGLSLVNQVVRGKVLPPWFSNVLDHAETEDRHWWHVYLDNFAAAERLLPSNDAQAASRCHELAEQAWSSSGVVSSEKKRVTGARQIVELGAEVDGVNHLLGVSTEKITKLIQTTLWFLAQRYLNKKHLQIIAGRWVFALQFRRPAMSVLDATWQFIGGKGKVTDKLKLQVRRELLSLIFMSPLLACDLGAKVADTMMASDASEIGGAVGVARSLTQEGKDFTQAASMAERGGGIEHAPILLISLFNGIGGCFRAYDVAGILPLARIAVECDDGANRITSRRWPGTDIVSDIHLVTRDLVRSWSRKYLGVLEIHIWSGFPCTDLSGVKYNRENLQGRNSQLFYEVPRVTNLVKEEFGPGVCVKEVVENVASMDEDAAREISAELGCIPYKLDPSQAVPMRRPRFCWSTESLEGLFPDVTLSQGRYWVDVHAEAPYPELGDWVEPGFSWKGGEQGYILPTCLKSIPRTQPPPRPAGLGKCDWATRQRWQDDQFRYPPYQYQEQYLFTSSTSWRLVNANEKELLLGYGHRHTELCWSASKIKQNKRGYSDARNSYLGDSFSIYSFVLFAVACARRFMPSVSYRHLVKRMGVSPGFRIQLRGYAPLQKGLCYGTPHELLRGLDLSPESLNRLLLRRANHTGSDIRIASGEIVNPKAFPRQSVQARWWHWEPVFAQRWKRKAHINVLELEALLLSVKHQVERFHCCNARIFHLSDSYVCISVVSKGRSASKQFQRVMRRLAALLLAHNLTLLIAHVESSENPTDAMSRQ